MRALRRTAQAEQDLLDIYLFIAADDAVAAEHIVRSLDARSTELCTHPELGPARDDIARGARHLVVDNYLVLYRITDKHIEIVRYLHGARDLQNLQ